MAPRLEATVRAGQAVVALVLISICIIHVFLRHAVGALDYMFNFLAEMYDFYPPPSGVSSCRNASCLLCTVSYIVNIVSAS